MYWFAVFNMIMVMAKGYREVPRDQLMLLPPDIREMLGPEHPVFLVGDLVRRVDTSEFHAGRKTGGAGAEGYDPDMMLTLLIWAYAQGVRSSRRIERLCRSDLAFVWICGWNRPDHVTIARFRAQHAAVMPVLFERVLMLCGRAGMGRVGVVALDGTKVAANASKSANRSLKTLREMAAEAVAAHAAADAAEDAGRGPGRAGDDVPAGLASPRSRAAARERRDRLARLVAEMEAEEKAAAAAGAAEQAAKDKAWRDRKAAGKRPGPPPAGAEVALAQEKLDAAVAAQQAKIDDWNARDAADRAAGGPGLSKRTRPKSPAGEHCRVRKARAGRDRALARHAAREAARAAREEENPRRRNATDPGSRLMPVRGGGFIQGWNPQNVASSDGLIIATEVTASTTDTTWFAPMLDKARAAAALIAASRPPRPATSDGSSDSDTGDGTGDIGLILADAGYLSQDNLTCPGPDRLIATGTHRHLEHNATPGKPPRPGKHATPAAKAMTRRLQTEEGITAYRQRGHIAETPHANIKHNLGFRQFSMRGNDKVTGEWHLITTVHNILTAISAGKITTQTLATL